MDLIVQDLMDMLEITNIQNLYIVIALIFGSLLLWRLKK